MPRSTSAEDGYRRARESLRQKREEAGLTLDALAERTGLNRATIHSIENVKREPDLKPDLDTVDRLVRALGLTLGEFFIRLEDSPSGLLTELSTSTSAGRPSRTSSGSPGTSVSDARIQESLLIAITQRLAERLDSAVDRLVAARTGPSSSRKQAPAARTRTAGRPGHHRELG